MRKRTLNNKGVALVTVVLFFLVLVILLGGVMFSSISNQGNAKLSKDHTSAYYIAESGMNITIEKLKDFLDGYEKMSYDTYDDKMDALYEYITVTLNNDESTLTGLSSTGKFTINTNKIDDEHFRIESVGEVNDVNRTIETIFKIEILEEDMMKAVYAKNSIIMENPNNVIEGPIASLMDDETAIILIESCTITEIYVPQEAIDDNRVVFDKNLDCDPEIEIKAIPNPDDIAFDPYVMEPLPTNTTSVNVAGGVLTLNNWIDDENFGYQISTLPSGSTRINLGTGGSSRVFKLVLDDSSSLRNASIEVVGEGELMIFTTVDANDTTASGNNANITYTYELSGVIVPDTTQADDLSKIQLYLRKGAGYTYSKDPIFTSKNRFTGAIIADEFDVFFQNGDIKGFVATLGDTITVKANTTILGPMWIFAPNADVYLNSGAYVEGAIIAENVVFSSGAELYYDVSADIVPDSVQLPLFEFGEPVPVGITVEFINFKEV